MTERIPGIHHITAVASDPQRNLDFYTGVLGLRLVKRTVNFDDPGTYHFYFGDALGHPGTILTFFPWPGIRRGRAGTSEVAGIAFSVPIGTIGAWFDRLRTHDTQVAPPASRFGDAVLPFEDPDGTRLELVETPRPAGANVWTAGGIPESQAIHGFHSAALCVGARGKTEALLTEEFGFEPVGEAGGRRRFRAASEGPGAFVDVVEARGAHRMELGAGSVHHIAWRTHDDETQARWLQRLSRRHLHVTPVQDRQYFHSIYFREPGGVLFEIATDPPGFTLDETPEHLGAELRLPPWLQPMRDRIERELPPVQVATPAGSSG